MLAANQGLYNGFLAAGLFWSLVHSDPGFAFQIKLLFLGAVVIAGLYGGATASRKIFVIQALPAAIALVAVLIAGARVLDKRIRHENIRTDLRTPFDIELFALDIVDLVELFSLLDLK